MTDVDPGEDLVGVREISERLHVRKTNVTNWVARRANTGFPEPITDLAMGPVYSWATVLEWYENYVPGRKRAKIGRVNDDEGE